MLFDILPVLIIFVALAIIVGVVLKRLPDIAGIKVESIPEAQSAATKRQILVQRLERKLSALAKDFWKGTATTRQSLRERSAQIYERLVAIEEKARHAQPQEETAHMVVDRSVTGLLAEAEQFHESGRREEAEKTYLEVIRLDHRNARGYYGLGRLYWIGEQYEEARQALEFAVRLKPGNVSYVAALAELAQEDGRTVDARQAYEQAASLSPDNVEYRIGLGDTAVAMKDLAGAIEAFEAAVAIEPSNPRCLDRLLEACILVGNKRLATTTLKRLAEVNPENKKLIEFRSRVAALSNRAKKST